MNVPLPHAPLLALEDAVEHALRTGEESGLDVLGYGEVTLVLRLATPDGPLACKRLPLFPDEGRFESYRVVLDEYLARLAERGVRVAPTALWSTRRGDGRIAAYCVQRALDPDNLVSRRLRAVDPDHATVLFDRVLAEIVRTVSPTLGLDAQASNWILGDAGLTYLDVTTPLLRDESAREKLDVRLFFTSLPWALRDVTRVTMSRSIFDKFYGPRGVVLDFLGNLHKERLGALVPRFLERANRFLDHALTCEEVQRYYDEDASMWALLQRLRRADRWWQRTIRRRPYPFLLPRAIAR